MPVLTKSQPKNYPKRNCWTMLKKLEKLVTDLSEKFDNITDRFTKISKGLKETKEVLITNKRKNFGN